MASQRTPHPQDRADTLLVRLVTIDIKRGESGLRNTTEEKHWITNDQLTIHKKKLHVEHQGELYEVAELRDQEKYTGDNMVRRLAGRTSRQVRPRSRAA